MNRYRYTQAGPIHAPRTQPCRLERPLAVRRAGGTGFDGWSSTKLWAAICLLIRHAWSMCRSIKTLRPPVVEQVTDTEVREAALQYVRKVSGYRVPSKANSDVFEEAVTAVERATQHLLDGLTYRK